MIYQKFSTFFHWPHWNPYFFLKSWYTLWSSNDFYLTLWNLISKIVTDFFFQKSRIKIYKFPSVNYEIRRNLIETLVKFFLFWSHQLIHNHKKEKNGPSYVETRLGSFWCHKEITLWLDNYVNWQNKRKITNVIDEPFMGNFLCNPKVIRW